jgi:hypothetical protein
MDDGELIQIQAETLFTYDGHGRIVKDNVPEGGAAPRLFVGRTRGGDVIRFSDALPDDVVQRLGALLEGEPPARDLRAPLTRRAQLRAVLAEHAPVDAEGGGPSYALTGTLTEPGGVVRVTEGNIHLVQHTFPELFRTFALVPVCFAVVRDGSAVSVCFSSRIGPRATEAEVETLPEFRGRGYAAAATAGWALAVREEGGIPLYTTSWQNLASQGVARRLGLTMYGADWWWQ